MQVKVADLSSLTSAERAVLQLLAQGHTIKSIAAFTGRSEGSFNERLREARRKTAVGSSRELARLLAQNSRDEETGVASRTRPRATAGDARHPRRRKLERFAMALLAFTVVAIAAFVQQPSPPPVRSGNDPFVLAEKLASEPRDAAWAPFAEALLRRRYNVFDGIAPSTLAVRCATTVCEVRGRLLRNDASRTVALLQAPSLADDLRAAGLVDPTHGFRSSRKGAALEVTFGSFWSRTDRSARLGRGNLSVDAN